MKKKLQRLFGVAPVQVDLSAIPGLEGCRTGQRLIRLGLLINALRIPATIAAMLLMTAVPCFAQTVGPIFNGNASKFGDMVREGMKLAAILLFVAGGVALLWMVVNIMRKQEWSHLLIGAIGAFGFGTLVAVIYNVSQGQPTDVGTNF